MAFKYKNYYVSYPGSVKIDAALPIDIRTVVSTLNDLYGTAALEDQTWKLAYNGLIVSVNETNEAFMCIDSANPYMAESWKKLNPDLDISGKMINIVEWNGQFYDATDVDHEHPIIDSLVDEEGKYLCLILNEDDDYVYIKSTDLIDLTDYYTKEQVDEKINILDSSVSNALDDIKDYIDTLDSALDEKINALDSSLTLLKDYIDEQDASIKDYVDTETDKIDQRLDGVDTSITNITNQITNFVSIVEEHFEEIDSSLNNVTADLEGVHETLDDIEERYDAAVERIDDHLDNIDSSVEELKSADTVLDNKIEDVSTRLAELEIGTVDSISTDTSQYLIIDTSKGDVSININASISTDPVNFQNTALVTNGYVDEKLAWVEVDGN